MAGWSYTDKGSPSDLMRIESIEMIPDPPERGQSLRAIVKATAQEEIRDGAQVEVTVKLGLTKLVERQYDLFDKLRGDATDWGLTADTALGGELIKPGNVKLTFSMDVPWEIPQAVFNVYVRAYSVDDENLSALDFRLDFMKRSPS